MRCRFTQSLQIVIFYLNHGFCILVAHTTCSNKDWFDIYIPCEGGTVLMGNDAACKAIGIGTIKIKMFDGVVRFGVMSNMF